MKKGLLHIRFKKGSKLAKAKMAKVRSFRKDNEYTFHRSSKDSRLYEKYNRMKYGY